MRRILKLSVVCLAAGVVTACNPDEIVETENIPTAGVRFINAVPDTGAMDFRFVDQVESNAHWQVAFRNNPVITSGIAGSTLVQYKNARAGQRHFRIFMFGTTSDVASTVVKDTTVTLEAGKLYTALLWGYANPAGPNRPAGAPAMRLTFIEEGVADPGAQVALRVINTTETAIDASQYPSGGTPPVTPTWDDVAALSRSTYVTAGAGQIRYSVTPAGGGATLFPDALALTGTAANPNPPGPFDAIPGTTVAGTAVTAIVWPPSVAGTGAPQLPSANVPSWQAPAITFIWDRRPPRPPGI